MTIKTLTFSATPEGRAFFRLLWLGFILGTTAKEAKSKDQIRKEARVLRPLRAISVPTTHDAALRELRKEGGTTQYEPADLELLDQALQRVPWGGGDTLDVADLFDFLSRAPESEKA